jgi:hypothetical protein
MMNRTATKTLPFRGICLVTALVAAGLTPARADWLMQVPASGPMPRHFSGTNFRVSGWVQWDGVPDPVHFLDKIELWVNDRRVAYREYPKCFPEGDDLAAVFDSTEFADASTIVVTVKVHDLEDPSDVWHSASDQAPAYNKGFVFGNEIPMLGGIGNLVKGYDVAQDMAGSLRQDNHTVQPLSATAAVNQRYDAILAAVPSATAFACYTHGNTGILGDSATGTPQGHWMTAAQLGAACGSKTVTQPPYNWVFVDACNAGITKDIAVAFGVDVFVGPPIPDRAFVGWATYMQDNTSLQMWTRRLHQYLLAGQRLVDAIANANQAGKPLDDFGVPADAKLYGDGWFKMHNVYLGDPGQFSRQVDP